MGPDVEGSPLTFSETVDGLLQFMECAIHTILHLRRVYPPEAFKLHRLYQLPVYRSRHPGLNEYITGIIDSLRAEVASQRIQRAILVLSSASTLQPLERYVFDFEFLLKPALGKADRDLSILGNVGFRQMHQSFRGFLLKLAMLDAGLVEVHDETDLTFGILMHTFQAKGNGRADVNPNPGPGKGKAHEPDEGFWVPADLACAKRLARARHMSFPLFQGTSSPMSGSKELLRGADTCNTNRNAFTGDKMRSTSTSVPVSRDTVVLPIRSLDTGVVNMMLYVEDHIDVKASIWSAKQQDCEDSNIKSKERRMETQFARDHRRESGVEHNLNPRYDDGGAENRPIEFDDQNSASNVASVPPTTRRCVDRASRQRGESQTSSGESNGAGLSSPSVSSSSLNISLASVDNFAGFGGAVAGCEDGGMSVAW